MASSQTDSGVNELPVSGVYRHFKGNFYFVLGVALHTETEELLVAYTRLYARDGIPFFVRPLASFLEPVVVEGKEVSRFTFVGASQPA